MALDASRPTFEARSGSRLIGAEFLRLATRHTCATDGSAHAVRGGTGIGRADRAVGRADQINVRFSYRISGRASQQACLLWSSAPVAARRAPARYWISLLL